MSDFPDLLKKMGIAIGSQSTVAALLLAFLLAAWDTLGLPRLLSENDLKLLRYRLAAVEQIMWQDRRDLWNFQLEALNEKIKEAQPGTVPYRIFEQRVTAQTKIAEANRNLRRLAEQNNHP